MRKIVRLTPGQVKPITYKIDTCHYLDWIERGQAQHLGNVTWKSGHGADSLVSQLGSTIKSPQVHTITSRYLLDMNLNVVKM